MTAEDERMGLVFRSATKKDLDRLVEIHMAAYPDERGVDERKRNFLVNWRGPFSDLVVVENGRELIAHAFLFQFRAWFGGRKVKMGGVASVAVAPEARGQGVATALLDELHRRSFARGDALVMLYAFRQGFYARLGYGGTTSRKRLAIDPAAIPRAWRKLAPGRVFAARGEDRDGICRAYERAAARTSGWLDRTEVLWLRRFVRDRLNHLVVRSKPTRGAGKVVGYVAFEVVQSEPHAETRILVEELVADDVEARCALLGALGAMRDQATVLELEVAVDDPIEFAIADANAWRHGTETVEHDLGTVVGGPMVRIEDVPRAIEARGYGSSGSLDIVVVAEPGRPRLALSVRIDDGRANVRLSRAKSPPPAPPAGLDDWPREKDVAALVTTRRCLASILYGGLRPSEAVRLGLADAPSRLLVRADELLTVAPHLPVDPF